MTSISEDETYKSSTQYRLWSFSPETLASCRKSTNHTAAVRVVAALDKAVKAKPIADSIDVEANQQDEHGSFTESTNKEPVETLTPTEEQILLTHYTRLMTQKVAHDAFGLPPHVNATAAQYLKRFYIQNSIMTYHPKSIFPACLYLAMKNCHHHMSLSRFTRQLGTGQSTEDIAAPEFLLCQGLRFCFDVRWPGRGLRGGIMEMLEMCRGKEAFGGHKVQTAMLQLPSVESGVTQEIKSQRAQKTKEIGEKYQEYLLEKRCMAAYESASGTLADSGLLTDAYLVYTPSQIWLAAMWLADAPLTEFYVSSKFRPSTQESTMAHPMSDERYSKVLSTIKRCTEMLSSYNSSNVEKKELIRIDKKLYGCLNPDKQDLIKLRNSQKKRNGDNGIFDGKIAKKRRLERQQSEKDDEIFGAEIVNKNGSSSTS